MKYSFNKSFFEHPNILNSYWAGFIAADGNLSIKKNNSHVLRIKLSPKDLSHLLLFKETIKYDGTLYVDKSSFFTDIGYPTITICAAQKYFKDLKENFNIVPNKTLTLEPPNLKSLENKLAFIVGYIDGDGCVYKDGKYIGIHVLGTKEVLEWMKDIFDLISIPSKRNPKVRKRNNIFEYKIVGKRAKEIKKILENIDVPKLDRKWSTN